MKAGNTVHDISSLDDIKVLIDSFYLKVKSDNVIGYVFNDIANVNWDHHLAKMYAFWEFLLLGGESYQGNPIEPHRKLNEKIPLQKAFFERWLELFTTTVDEHFSGKVAEEAKHKAMMIGITWMPKFG